MSELVVQPVKIEKIKPHPNADKLEIAVVGGWEIITGKGNYVEGDVVVHIQPDSMVPRSQAQAWGVEQYLAFKKNSDMGRVRAARLRGHASFGFLVPNESGAALGTDLSEHYGIEKYEPPPPPVGMSAGQMRSEHPLFHRYTDIQNLRNHPDKLAYGEPLVITEKIHGCLVIDSPICMADGSKKRIADIRIGEYVLGVSDGQVVSTKVTNVFNNGKADEWMSVECSRRGAGRGNHYASVKCTPNHKFWCKNNPGDSEGYTAASDLSVGDTVCLIRSELALTPIQEQVLIGKMLGDGSLADHGVTASIDFGHKKDHEEYLHWTLRGLGDLAGNQQKDQVSGYGTTMCRGRTISSVHIRRLFEDWISENGKQVPRSIIGKIGPIALAFWYMDDGSLQANEDQEDRACFAVCGFSEQSVSALIGALDRLGISGTPYKNDGQWRIRLNADEAEKMFLMIAPYVPSIMQYKLPERYRGHQGWLPTKSSQYKPILVEQTVTAINRNISVSSSRYDIETETHNFFANGVLVHNSNSRVGWVRRIDKGEHQTKCPRSQFWDAGEEQAPCQCDEFELVVGTHRTQRDPEDCGVYGLPLQLHGDMLGRVFEQIERWWKSHDDELKSVIFFGEIYGAGVQDLHYGAKQEKEYRLFDIAINGEYLPWSTLEYFQEQFDLPLVPVLTRGVFDFEQLVEEAQGDTTLEDDHIREGIVVRPWFQELFWGKGTQDPCPKRMIFKLISDAYLTRKGGTEYH